MTDNLIADLSLNPPRPTRVHPTAVVLGAAALSLLLALILSIVWLRPRSDLSLPLLFENYTFLLKLVFSLSVAVPATLIVRDLSVPGRAVKSASLLSAVPLVLIAVLVLHEFLGRQVSPINHHGSDPALDCLWQIPALASPALIILMTTVQHLGPTDLNRAGAYIGVVSGGIGAAAYALHCSHDSALFVGVAYTLAILEMAVLGALLGPPILRWSWQDRRS